MEANKILTAIEEEVEELFRKNVKPYLLYHNVEHTRKVVKHAREIGTVYALDQQAWFVLLAAAWFHDTGHLLGNMEQHEALGVRIMRMFLAEQVEEPVLMQIDHCIMATSIAIKPVSLVEKILCDADTYHLGTPEFRETDTLVWQELEMRMGHPIQQKEEKSLHFLESHTFYTQYCKNLLDKGKSDNIEWLKEKIH